MALATDHRATVGGIERLFSPRSVAIIGASGDPGRFKFSRQVVEYLQRYGFRGDIYPVNPKYEQVLGLRCYPSVTAIGRPVDAALVALSAARVPDALTECAAAGVQGAAVISSGFREAGAAGLALQERITEIARDTGMRVCGPNTNGIIGVPPGATLSFCAVLQTGALRPGNLGLISQSGGLGSIALCYAYELGMGFFGYACTGNEADLDVADFVKYMAAEPQVEVIGVMLEGTREGRRFLIAVDAARAAGKAVIVLKAARTTPGKSASLSHTGALAGEGAVWQGVLAQHGAIQVGTPYELIHTAYLLGTKGRAADMAAAARAGGRVGILSHGGGMAVLMADKAAEVGLTLAPLDPSTAKAKIPALLGTGPVVNPVDTAAANDASAFQGCLEALIDDPTCDAVVAGFTTPLALAASQPMIDAAVVAAAGKAKPVVALYTTAGDITQAGLRELQQGPLPVFTRYEDCLVALRHVLLPSAPPADPAAAPRPGRVASVPGLREELLATARRRPQRLLMEHECHKLLAELGIATPPGQLCRDEETALTAAATVGYPVAVKIQSPAIAHKAAAGGVVLGVRGPADLGAAVRRVLAAAPPASGLEPAPAVLVQALVWPQGELVVGLRQDAAFGPVLMFGLGGALVEALDRVAFAALPLTPAGADLLLRPVAGVLQRLGGDALTERLTRVLCRISAFGEDLGAELGEFEINPLAVTPDCLIALDCLMRVR